MLVDGAPRTSGETVKTTSCLVCADVETSNAAGQSSALTHSRAGFGPCVSLTVSLEFQISPAYSNTTCALSQSVSVNVAPVSQATSFCTGRTASLRSGTAWPSSCCSCAVVARMPSTYCATPRRRRELGFPDRAMLDASSLACFCANLRCHLVRSSLLTQSSRRAANGKQGTQVRQWHA